MIQITTPRGIHVRPSKILYRKIRDIKSDVYIIHRRVKHKIKDVLDILRIGIGQYENIDFEISDDAYKWRKSELYKQVDIINNHQY